MIIHQKSSQKGEVGWGVIGIYRDDSQIWGIRRRRNRCKTTLQLIFENISGKIGFDPLGYFWGDAGDGNQLLERGFLDIFD